jgi:hypothetical protein
MKDQPVNQCTYRYAFKYYTAEITLNRIQGHKKIVQLFFCARFQFYLTSCQIHVQGWPMVFWSNTSYSVLWPYNRANLLCNKLDIP